jgi:Transposase DDE domain
MTLDVNTFLTIVYCTVDPLDQRQIAPAKPHRPGRHPELADSEVLTLMLLAQWHPSRSERKAGCYAAKHWRSYFPRLLSQSQFNRRARDLHGVFARLATLLAEEVIATLHLDAPYEVLDGVPVPLMARTRGDRHCSFACEASLGCGGSDHDWYYGMQLLLTVTPCGLITGLTLGPAGTEERWVADALLRWRVAPTAPAPTLEELRPRVRTDHSWRPAVGPTGPMGPSTGAGSAQGRPILADLGFTGVKWAQHWREDYGVEVLTQADYGSLPKKERQEATRWFHGLRQVVETANGWLDARFGLKRPRAHSYWGVLTRIAAKVAAFNLGVYLNHLFERPTFAFFDPFD